MLAIQIEESWLDLPPNAAMNITLNNPAFDPERIGRAYSYPIKIQHTQRNLFTTKHRHRIDSRLPQQYVDAKAYIKDQLFEEGRINFTEGGNKSTEAVFQNLDLDLGETLQGIKIHDLLSVIQIPQVHSAEYWFDIDGDQPYALHVNGVNYVGTAATNPNALLDLASNINAVYPGIATGFTSTSRLRIMHTDPDIVLTTPSQLTLDTEQTLGDAHHTNMTDYYTSASLDDSYPVAFPVVYAPRLYGNLNPDFTGYINHIGIVNQNAAASNLWENTYIPFYRVRYILDQIATQAGLEDILFDVPTAQADSLNSLLIWNNYALDQVYENKNFDANTFKNGFASSIDPTNHVPDDTALEFINRLAQSLNFHFRFRANRIYLKPNLRQIQTPQHDWTQYTQPYYDRTFIPGTGVTMSFEEDIDVQPVGQLEPFVLGEGYNDLELPFRPVPASTRLNPISGYEWKTATIEQPGTSPPLDLETEQQVFRLFFDHGQQVDENNDTYWMASYDYTDYAGTEIGAFSLDFPGDQGLYATWWKDWALLLFSPVIKRLIALPVDALLQMRKWNRTKVYIYDNQGSAMGVVRSIQFKANANGLGIAQVELQKLSGV